MAEAADDMQDYHNTTGEDDHGDIASFRSDSFRNEPGVISVNEDVAQLVVDNEFSGDAVSRDVVLAMAEETLEDGGDSTELIDKENDMTWVSLVWMYIVAVSAGAFRFAEYLGEKLADLFGITSPRYGYVMEEWDRIQWRQKQEEKERAEEQEKYQQALALKNEAVEGGTASHDMPYRSDTSSCDDLNQDIPHPNIGSNSNTSSHVQVLGSSQVHPEENAASLLSSHSQYNSGQPGVTLSNHSGPSPVLEDVEL